MTTREEFIKWLKYREEELISLQYQLIDSLNNSDIDSKVREMRGHVWGF